MFSSIVGAVGSAVSNVFGFLSTRTQAKAQENIAKQQAVISKEQTSQVQSSATANIATSYYDAQKAEAQQDTIIKVALILGVVLVLITRLKRK
jgi:outer membrane protein TolC